ncbi:ABC transporter substrate-binding protein [Streptomyces sp. NBC_01614]|uniref:ABC transporter substrate-binding protein n=1 Tax=Streptomyces sp. NBC_01614 TaxID=2975897 RepID=UPI00386E50BB
MEPLRGADPARIAGYRLLSRLGAGGMGVVYLARSPKGALAAVKVIRSAYVDDAGFRARFRREVQTAGRVASPWVVPLLDADPDADAPWLATPFVPGPSLSEAVEECGPLPYASVRVLGTRLAEALDAVHGAGLVHRDIKPGNVLLGVDGPRVIDFGIARIPQDTALTASGMVVGSPGFLSPEQAQGKGREIGPASDVFSLGCLLAYAVSGGRPFGRGSAAATLMHTVHDEPDLDGVPHSLLPLLKACLAKAPGSRPAVAEVLRALHGAHEDGGWLPEPVTRMIARRTADVLALPAVDATEVSAKPAAAAPLDGVTAAGTDSMTRRRLLVLGSSTGVLAAGGAALWWTACSPARPGSIRLPQLVLGLHADLSGSSRTVGRAQENGVRLAVDRFNSRQGRSFELQLSVHDDEGSPSQARQVAHRLAANHRIRAVLGPTTDACAKAALGLYQQALLAMVTVSVGLDDVSPTAYRVYAATRPSDLTLAAPIVAYLVHTAKAHKAMLIDDAAEGDVSWRLCAGVEEALRSGRHSTIRHTLAAKDRSTDAFRALARTVMDAGADAVLFAGQDTRAAQLAQALRSAGYTGARLATQHSLTPHFLTSAEDAAEGWVFATAFLDPTKATAAQSFVTSYRARFGTVPPWYSAEAYDATLFVARTLTALGSSRPERHAIVGRLHETDYHGIAKRLNYDPSSYRYTDAMYLFRVTGGTYSCLGDYRNITA